MGMIRKVSSQIKYGRVKEFALVRFTLFWVTTLKSILLLGAQKLKQIRIYRPFYRKSSPDPNETFEDKSVCISNEIQEEEDIYSDIEVNSDICGFRNLEQDIFESISTEETIAEIEKCEEIRDEASESESDRRNGISNQSVVSEDFIEETNADYFKNFSLYSVLFLPTISIQFYLSVLLLLFYAYRKKLFATYLGNEESNRVKETESNTLVQSENCEENMGSKMTLDDGSQQIMIERNWIEGKEKDHEKSDESMITSESLSIFHETGTLINVNIPGKDLGKVEAQNIINESIESKIKKDVAFEVCTLDNLEVIKQGIENEERTSILAQESQININKDELHARNEIRNSFSISDEDAKDDSKDKSNKTESNTLDVSEVIPNGTEQISVSEIKRSKYTSFPSCLVDENKKEIRENPKMKVETINNESNEEVCFLKDDILDARALKEAETFKADGEKYSSNEIRERSNQQSKKTCFSKIEENKLNGLIPSLTNSIEMGETENMANNTREVQSKDVSFRSVGDNPLQKDLSKYGTDKETLGNLNEDDQKYEETVSNTGEFDAQISTSAYNDGIQKHVDVNLEEFENKQDSLSKGYEPNHPRKINVVRTVIRCEGTENFKKDSIKPRMKECNTNDKMDSNELRPEIKNITFGKVKSLDEAKVLDPNYKTNEYSTYTNTEIENAEKVPGEKELDEFVNKDEVAYLMHTKSTCICEEVKVVYSKRCTEREYNKDQASLGRFSKENNCNCHEAFQCSENSTKNEQFTDSVEKVTLSSEKFVDETISASNNSLKLTYGPLIFKTSVDDGSKFAFKFRSGVKHKEMNNKANRSCEISFKKL